MPPKKVIQSVVNTSDGEQDTITTVKTARTRASSKATTRKKSDTIDEKPKVLKTKKTTENLFENSENEITTAKPKSKSKAKANIVSLVNNYSASVNNEPDNNDSSDNETENNEFEIIFQKKKSEWDQLSKDIDKLVAEKQALEIRQKILRDEVSQLIKKYEPKKLSTAESSNKKAVKKPIANIKDLIKELDESSDSSSISVNKTLISNSNVIDSESDND